jgi:hypothetical protein
MAVKAEAVISGSGAVTSPIASNLSFVTMRPGAVVLIRIVGKSGSYLPL